MSGKKLNRQQAINAFCKTCIYDPHGGNGSWLNQVEGCTATNCPLYEHRPLTSATVKAEQEARFDAMNDREKQAYLAEKEIKAQRLNESLSRAKNPENKENPATFL